MQESVDTQAVHHEGVAHRCLHMASHADCSAMTSKSLGKRKCRHSYISTQASHITCKRPCTAAGWHTGARRKSSSCIALTMIENTTRQVMLISKVPSKVLAYHAHLLFRKYLRTGHAGEHTSFVYMHPDTCFPACELQQDWAANPFSGFRTCGLFLVHTGCIHNCRRRSDNCSKAHKHISAMGRTDAGWSCKHSKTCPSDDRACFRADSKSNHRYRSNDYREGLPRNPTACLIRGQSLQFLGLQKSKARAMV